MQAQRLGGRTQVPAAALDQPVGRMARREQLMDVHRNAGHLRRRQRPTAIPNPAPTSSHTLIGVDVSNCTLGAKPASAAALSSSARRPVSVGRHTNVSSRTSLKLIRACLASRWPEPVSATSLLWRRGRATVPAGASSSIGARTKSMSPTSSTPALPGSVRSAGSARRRDSAPKNSPTRPADRIALRWPRWRRVRAAPR